MPAQNAKAPSKAATAKAHAEAAATAKAKPPVSTPGKRMGNILSLHAAKAEKVQKAASKLELTHQRLLLRAEQTSGVADQIFAAVLAVVDCPTLPRLRACLQTTVKDILAVSAARLILAGPEGMGASAATLPAAAIDALCPGQVCLRALVHAQDRELYGPKGKLMKSDCLLKLCHNGRTLGLLALGSADPAQFHAGQSTHMAAFLAQVIGTCLARASK
jgi:uncharacterized protein YigA (DUF484 family)